MLASPPFYLRGGDRVTVTACFGALGPIAFLESFFAYNALPMSTSRSGYSQPRDMAPQGGSAGSFGCGCCSVSFSILVTQSVTIDGLLMLLPIACAHFVGTPLNSPAAQHGAPTCAGWSDSV